MPEFTLGVSARAGALAKMPNARSARKTPARQSTKPIPRRRLKKADCETDVFFIGGFLFLFTGGGGLRPKRYSPSSRCLITITQGELNLRDRPTGGDWRRE